MRKDPTAFRERFKKWKETGEYELPRFEDGKENYQYEGYNYNYQNKTSKGYSLSIKNGRAYLNGKIAGSGYTWYDKNNGNKYRTIGKGKFKLISTQEGPITTTDQGRAAGRESFRQDPNTRGYLESLDKNDLTATDKWFLYQDDFVNKRYDKEKLFRIPQHLPGVKRRTLSSGLYKGIKVYDNTLDTLYNQAKANDTDFKTLLGLAAETSLNRDYHMTMNENKHEYNEVKKHPAYLQSDYHGRYYIYPTDILNNHNYFVGNNVTGTINTLINKKIIPGVASWKDGGNPFPYLQGDRTEKQDSILSSEINKALKSKEHSSDNPWTNAIDFYKKYNYGMGSSYPALIEQRGNSILKTPEIQAYLTYRQ